MDTALLIDIGSTYTKAAVIDLENLIIIKKSKSLTTAEENVLTGLKSTLVKLNVWEKARYKLACSSAAGGLKIVAVGLVPELTVEAARRAALGAGSRVLKAYCYELTSKDVEEISRLIPDIILLSGGTDGGNKENIIRNAETLADSDIDCPFIIAGNRSAADEVKYILDSSGKNSYITENVMPELEELNIEPARCKIREIFLNNIIKARGLDRVKEIIDGVIMPTPAAVLKAASLLAQGYGDTQGLGELLVVDVGGATTDVHSVAAGEPSSTEVSWRGLKEPFVKRTVEGDVGMRFNAPSLLELIGIENIIKQLYTLIGEKISSHKLQNYIMMLHKNIEYLPDTIVEKAIDRIMARNAVKIAVARHVGSIKTVHTPMGPAKIQEGKDLSGLNTVIGTGGIIVNNKNCKFILNGTLYKNQDNPLLLAPVNPKFLLDREYIMALCGLLAGINPLKALQLLKKYIK